LKDKRNKLKVRNIRKLRNKGIAIEVNSQVDVDIINRSNLESVDLVITAPKKQNPNIVIYDVDKDCSRDELKEDFIEKNLPWSTSQERCDLEQAVNFKYSFKSKNDRMVNWVVQLPGSHFHKIINAERVFMGWKTYRIKEYINIVRCFKCHGYGHIAMCSVPKQLCDYCSSEEHAREDCKQRGAPLCINCIRFKKKQVQHHVRDRLCPEYIRQLDLYKTKLKWR